MAASEEEDEEGLAPGMQEDLITCVVLPTTRHHPTSCCFCLSVEPGLGGLLRGCGCRWLCESQNMTEARARDDVWHASRVVGRCASAVLPGRGGGAGGAVLLPLRTWRQVEEVVRQMVSQSVSGSTVSV